MSRHVAAQRSRCSGLVLKTAATRGPASGVRRRHCSGNASVTQKNAYKTPAAATAKTPRSGLTTADTRAAMTAESTAVCNQRTAEGRHSRGAQRPGRATDRRPLAPGSWWTTMRSSRRPARTLPAAPKMRAAPNPRTFTGWSGASPHVLRFPCGLSSGFPFARRALPLRPPSLVSHRPAFSGSFPSAVAQVPLSPPVSLRVPFPLSNLHVSAAARRFCRRWSRAAGTKVTSSAATTSPGSRDPPALQMGSDWARWDAATESPDMRRGAGYAVPPRASCRTILLSRW